MAIRALAYLSMFLGGKIARVDVTHECPVMLSDHFARSYLCTYCEGASIVSFFLSFFLLCTLKVKMLKKMMLKVEGEGEVSLHLFSPF